MWSRLWMLIVISTRNLLSSRLNIAIGLLILGGTFFFVVLGALVESLDRSMARSVVGSIAGNLQVYSAKSKDELSLYGNPGGGDSDLTGMTEFPRIRAALLALPHVKAVVPMGSSRAIVPTGNLIDVTLERLRNLIRARDGQSTDPALNALPRAALDAMVTKQVAHVRQIIKVLQADADKAKAILAADAVDPADQKALATVATPEFWNTFASKPYDALEFLENRIAPQIVDAQFIQFPYIGTDLDEFQKSFDRMHIIEGTMVPPGRRGFLLPKFVYEDQLKLKQARRFDLIKDGLADGKKIATDEAFQRMVKLNRTQTRDITLQLDAESTAAMVKDLQGFLTSTEPSLGLLLAKFFETDDANFAARYDFFYAKLVPRLQLYRLRIGDILTLKAFTSSGAATAVNVKIYGTFSFSGLEKSPIAGATALIDLMSFRDLYGYLTTDKKEELASLQQSQGARKVSRENAEAELFGGDTKDSVQDIQATTNRADEAVSGSSRRSQVAERMNRAYSQDEINSGVVLNAAVWLDNQKYVPEVAAAIERVSKEQNLDLKTISWQKAAGVLGQIITFMHGLLGFSTFFIFLVAVIIINNAMMMATIQRTTVLGTLRAIGASKALVLAMVLLETVVLAVVFGGIGIALGALVVSLLHTRGIGAPNDIAYFFFSGPRLLPDLSIGNLITAAVITMVVAIISTILPAYIATRVSPLRAMQTDTT